MPKHDYTQENIDTITSLIGKRIRLYDPLHDMWETGLVRRISGSGRFFYFDYQSEKGYTIPAGRTFPKHRALIFELIDE